MRRSDGEAKRFSSEGRVRGRGSFTRSDWMGYSVLFHGAPLSLAGEPFSNHKEADARMCGIAGFATSTSMTGVRLAGIAGAMAASLSHRGPDDDGIWVDERHGVALGHRRLSILDLSQAGHQPMVSADGRLVLVFNGEVYNYRALRRELTEVGGHRFRGESDTEVVLAAVSAWGLEQALKRFNGMFAMAVWDRERRVLYLARDRMGIKPLYYGWSGSTFLFASELKAFRVHPEFDPRVDRHALTLYFRYGYVPSPYAIYQGVHKLEPGRMLVLKWGRVPEGALPEPEVRTYWSLLDVWQDGVTRPFEGPTEELLCTLDTTLRQAVRDRMVADVPLGAFLSGGIDSSLVVALMQAQASGPVKTFCIGFDDARFDEAEQAQAVATHLGTDHTTLRVGPADALDVVPLIPRYWDEPFGDSSQIPTYLVSALTRRHVTVSLSGDGGDELFAGYERYRLAGQWRYLRRVPPLVRGAAARLSVGRPRKLLKVSRRAGPSLLWRLEALAVGDFRSLYRYFMSHHKHPTFLVRGGHELTTWLSGGPPPESLGDLVQQLTFWDMVSYLPDDILTKVDRASMAVGLEARVPLLDHRVVALSARIPTRYKIRNRRQKWLLRKLLHRYVPAPLVDRPKMGFSVPIRTWLENDLQDWAEHLLDPANIRATGLLNVRAIRRLWKDFRRGHAVDANLLWTILMFLAWMEMWG